MKTAKIENVVTDENGQPQYIVMAPRVLTDGELYSAIRVDILRRGGRPAKGERVVINATDLP